MKKLLNPIWIFGITVFPMILLFLLVRSEYMIFQSMLEPAVKELWTKFCWMFFVLFLCMQAMPV